MYVLANTPTWRYVPCCSEALKPTALWCSPSRSEISFAVLAVNSTCLHSVCKGFQKLDSTARPSCHRWDQGSESSDMPPSRAVVWRGHFLTLGGLACWLLAPPWARADDHLPSPLVGSGSSPGGIVTSSLSCHRPEPSFSLLTSCFP